MAISTIPCTATQFSNVGQYPIDVTLEITLTILLFRYFNVTQKSAVTVIADGKSKYTGMKILRLLVTGCQYHQP
jgi:hypothetical protein